MSTRPSIVCALTIVLAATGCRQILGLSDLAPLPDSAAADAPIVVPGTHSHYVINAISVPTNNTQARDDGLDLNGDKTVDNALGMVFGTFAGQGVDIQSLVSTGVAKGLTIALVDVIATDFTTSDAASIALFAGADPVPAPCLTTSDTVCARHLQGNGAFAIAAGSATNAPLIGPIAAGTLTTSSAGNLALQLSLGGATPLSLPLIGARIQAMGISATGITSLILAGAITQTDLTQQVIPGLRDDLVLPALAKDCPGATAADIPSCNCVDGTVGKQLIALLDTMPADCMVTIGELENNGLFSSLFQPDVTIDEVAAFSVGVKATAVTGTFTSGQ